MICPTIKPDMGSESSLSPKSIAIESIAKMMGHSNIIITQGYAKITEDKISKGMDKLIEKRSKTNNNVTV